MDEKFLFKISLLCSLLGIFIILLIVERLDVGEFSIDSVNLSLVDKEVKVKGYITSIKETPGLYLLTIKDSSGQITAVIFKDDPIDIKKDQLIEIEGIVVNYNNKPEIQAKRIKVF